MTSGRKCARNLFIVINCRLIKAIEGKLKFYEHREVLLPWKVEHDAISLCAINYINILYLNQVYVLNIVQQFNWHIKLQVRIWKTNRQTGTGCDDGKYCWKWLALQRKQWESKCHVRCHMELDRYGVVDYLFNGFNRNCKPNSENVKVCLLP